jgi:phage-related protein
MDLIIDGISSSEYGFCLFERPNIPTPERDVEYVRIRGRNGSLVKKYGWLDIEIPVQLNLLSDDLKSDLRAFKSVILNAREITFTDDNGFYKVNNVRMSDIENEVAEYGLFDVTFVCKPFLYVLVPKVALSAPGTIYNPGTENAEPYIKVTGSGLITLDIDGRDILLNLTDYVEIDTEKGYAHKGTAGADNLVSGDLPILTPGYNNISWTGTVQTVEIEYKAVFL